MREREEIFSTLPFVAAAFWSESLGPCNLRCIISPFSFYIWYHPGWCDLNYRMLSGLGITNMSTTMSRIRRLYSRQKTISSITAKVEIVNGKTFCYLKMWKKSYNPWSNCQFQIFSNNIRDFFFKKKVKLWYFSPIFVKNRTQELPVLRFFTYFCQNSVFGTYM